MNLHDTIINVAEQVMGWKRGADFNVTGGNVMVKRGVNQYEQWNPVRNDVHAAELLQRMRVLMGKKKLTYGDAHTIFHAGARLAKRLEHGDQEKAE